MVSDSAGAPCSSTKATATGRSIKVLAALEQCPGSTLADFYDPVSMPPKLAKAHELLDRAVDRCYRKETFLTDRWIRNSTQDSTGQKGRGHRADSRGASG